MHKCNRRKRILVDTIKSFNLLIGFATLFSLRPKLIMTKTYYFEKIQIIFLQQLKSSLLVTSAERVTRRSLSCPGTNGFIRTVSIETFTAILISFIITDDTIILNILFHNFRFTFLAPLQVHVIVLSILFPTSQPNMSPAIYLLMPEINLRSWNSTRIQPISFYNVLYYDVSYT